MKTYLTVTLIMIAYAVGLYTLGVIVGTLLATGTVTRFFEWLGV